MPLLYQGVSDRKPFELVLIDARMADLDGFELAHRLQEEPCFDAVKRVMMSSSGLSSDVTRAREAGFLGYVAKPFSPQQLLNVLTRVHGFDLTPSVLTRETTELRASGFDFGACVSALDADVLTELAPAFRLQWESDLARLLQAQLDKDWPAVRRISSVMQESLLIFDALPLFNLAKCIGLVAQEGDVDALPGLTERLRLGAEQLLGAISRALAA